MDEPGFGHGSGSKPQPFPITSPWPPVDPGSSETFPAPLRPPPPLRRGDRNQPIGMCEHRASCCLCDKCATCRRCLPTCCLSSSPSSSLYVLFLLLSQAALPSNTLTSLSELPGLFLLLLSVGVKLKETAFAPFSVPHFCSASLSARAHYSECTFHP